MIPKIIHYSWFGGKKNKMVQNYIKEWKKKLPEYKFIEWNEKNFCVNKYMYSKQAYEAKKYAFVSDVARLEALYNFGGVYLDTDIEIKKDFYDLISERKLVLGYEAGGSHLMTAFIAAEKKNNLIGAILKNYEEEHFINDNGKFNLYPNTYRITKFLSDKNYIIDGKFSESKDVLLCPEEYFSAMNFFNMKEISNEKTYTVHHFNASWKPWHVKVRRKIKIWIIKKIEVIKECIK